MNFVSLFVAILAFSSAFFGGYGTIYAADNATQFHPQATVSPVVPATAHQGTPERTLYNVTIKDAEKMIGDALVAAGVAGNVTATVIGDRSHPLNQSAAPIKTSVENLQFDTKSGNWSAQLVFADNTVDSKSLPVRGRFTEMVNIPTLTKMVDAGVKIAMADIQMTPYSAQRLSKSMVLKPEELIGKAPKRGMGAGIPIRQEELTIGADLPKGSQVTLKYENRGMLINAPGETLEAGILGSRVRVKNAASKAIITGTLEDGAVVSITPSKL